MAHRHGEHALFGVDQGNTRNHGRAVVGCDGRTGTVAPDGPHCSYNVTIVWADGTRSYTPTACLWWADDPSAPQVR